ncbi:hypothetical protein [Nonomuraea sp. SBT364]|uniref:hypothetical protein n=1 Tax=Nonomuraea sp. SBT364 TaxID=1580530 RepID=UPI00066BBEC9|nr:hypothetical protein [Nonomuraea sp. SBT364]
MAQLDTIEVVKGHSAKGTGGRPSMRYLYVTPEGSDETHELIDLDTEETPEIVIEVLAKSATSEEAAPGGRQGVPVLPCRAEMLQEILKGMMAKQAVASVPHEGAAARAKAPTQSRAKGKAEALFQAPEVAA